MPRPLGFGPWQRRQGFGGGRCSLIARSLLNDEEHCGARDHRAQKGFLHEDRRRRGGAPAPRSAMPCSSATHSIVGTPSRGPRRGRVRVSCLSCVELAPSIEIPHQTPIDQRAVRTDGGHDGCVWGPRCSPTEHYSLAYVIRVGADGYRALPPFSVFITPPRSRVVLCGVMPENGVGKRLEPGGFDARVVRH